MDNGQVNLKKNREVVFVYLLKTPGYALAEILQSV